MTSTAEQVHWICKVPLGITLCTVGIFGNLLSIIVWRKVIRTMWSRCSNRNPSTANYLVFLGVVDSGVLVSLFVVDSLPWIRPSVRDSYLYGVLFSWLFHPLLFLFFIASVLLVAGVTVNRWALVRFPIRSMEYYSARNTFISLAAVILFSALLNIPMWFTHTVQIVPVQPQNRNAINATNKVAIIESSSSDCSKANRTNMTIKPPLIKASIRETEYGQSKAFFNYMSWCHCVMFVDIPWFAVAVLNVLIFRKMKEQNRIRGISAQNEMRRKKEERNLTFMLLSSTSAFIICLSVHCITNTWRRISLLHHIHGHTGKLSPDVDIGSAFGRLGIVLNSSTNCLFYCFGGKTFRKILKKTITRQSSSIVPIIFINSQRSSKAAAIDVMKKVKIIRRVCSTGNDQNDNLKFVCEVKCLPAS